MDNLKDIEIEDFDDHIVVYFYGDLSIKNIKDIDEVLNKELNKDIDTIGINCSYLNHVDSISINHLVKFSKKASNKGIEIIFFCLNDHIENIFTTINLDKLVKISSKEQFDDFYIGKKFS